MAQAISNETLAKISVWRAKAADGTITREDYKEAIRLLRADRLTAQAASDSSRRSRARAAIPSADDMLAELGE